MPPTILNVNRAPLRLFILDGWKAGEENINSGKQALNLGLGMVQGHQQQKESSAGRTELLNIGLSGAQDCSATSMRMSCTC